MKNIYVDCPFFCKIQNLVQQVIFLCNIVSQNVNHGFYHFALHPSQLRYSDKREKLISINSNIYHGALNKQGNDLLLIMTEYEKRWNTWATEFTYLCKYIVSWVHVWKTKQIVPFMHHVTLRGTQCSTLCIIASIYWLIFATEWKEKGSINL